MIFFGLFVIALDAGAKPLGRAFSPLACAGP